MTLRGEAEVRFEMLGRWPVASRELLQARVPDCVRLSFDSAESGLGFISPADVGGLAEAGTAMVTVALALWDRVRARRRSGATDDDDDAGGSVSDVDEFNERLKADGQFGQRVISIEAGGSSPGVVLTVADELAGALRKVEVTFGDHDVKVRLE